MYKIQSKSSAVGILLLSGYAVIFGGFFILALIAKRRTRKKIIEATSEETIRQIREKLTAIERDPNMPKPGWTEEKAARWRVAVTQTAYDPRKFGELFLELETHLPLELYPHKFYKSYTRWQDSLLERDLKDVELLQEIDELLEQIRQRRETNANPGPSDMKAERSRQLNGLPIILATIPTGEDLSQDIKIKHLIEFSDDFVKELVIEKNNAAPVELAAADSDSDRGGGGGDDTENWMKDGDGMDGEGGGEGGGPDDGPRLPEPDDFQPGRGAVPGPKTPVDPVGWGLAGLFGIGGGGGGGEEKAD